MEMGEGGGRRKGLEHAMISGKEKFYNGRGGGWLWYGMVWYVGEGKRGREGGNDLRLRLGRDGVGLRGVKGGWGGSWGVVYLNK